MRNNFIESLDDIIIGMTLTMENKNSLKVKVLKVNSNIEYGIEVEANDGGIYHCQLISFKEYKEPSIKSINKYTVVKTFSPLDLFITGDKSCKEFNEEFTNLLKEIEHFHEITWGFETIEDIYESDVLSRHLSYLKEKGYIRLISPIVKAGIKLQYKYNNEIEIYEVLNHGDNKCVLLYKTLNKKSCLIFNGKEPFYFDSGISLNKLALNLSKTLTGKWSIIV